MPPACRTADPGAVEANDAASRPRVTTPPSRTILDHCTRAVTAIKRNHRRVHLTTRKKHIDLSSSQYLNFSIAVIVANWIGKRGCQTILSTIGQAVDLHLSCARCSVIAQDFGGDEVKHQRGQI